MKEGELKTAVSDYLEYGTNQGKWYADRLNSGAVTVARGYAKYKIQLCREGTADFVVIVRDWIVPRVIFLELKGDKGRQSPEQGAFQKLVEAQGAEYYVIKSIEELENILGGNR